MELKRLVKPRKGRNSIATVHLRQCIACRSRKSLELLIRLVVREGDLVIDFKRVQPGRGAHVCDSELCVRRLGKKGLLNHSFRLGASKKSRKQGVKPKSSPSSGLFPRGERTSDSVIRGVDAVMEKLLARINDKDSHI